MKHLNNPIIRYHTSHSLHKTDAKEMSKETSPETTLFLILSIATETYQFFKSLAKNSSCRKEDEGKLMARDVHNPKDLYISFK